MDELIITAKDQLDYIRSAWIDLPGYVHSDEYENALMNWIKKHIENGRTDVIPLVTYALHHETGDRKPYFPFERS